MRQDYIHDILRTLDTVFKQLGAEGGFDEAAKAVQQAYPDVQHDPSEQSASAQIGMTVAEQLFRQCGGDSLKKVMENLGRFSTLDQLERALAEAPDPDEEDFTALEQFKKLPTVVRKALGDVTRTIRPKGGHPVVVPRSKYAEICDNVAHLSRVGMPLGSAKERVAAKYGCSLSTVNQIWRTRGKVKPAKRE